MTSRFIGLKELRQNMAKITADALKKNQRLVVFKKNVPIFELRPLSKAEIFDAEMALSLARAEEDIKAGRTYSQEEVEKRLGIR